MKCPNCGSALSCGCQKRVASDGAQVCTNCLSSYEIKIQSEKAKNAITNQPRMRQQTSPVVNSIEVKVGSL